MTIAGVDPYGNIVEMSAMLRREIIRDELETRARIINLQRSKPDWYGREVATRIWQLHRQRTDPLRQQLAQIAEYQVNILSMQAPTVVI